MKLFSRHRKLFSDPEQAPDDGLVAMGDEMSVDILLEAYSFGIFPWPHDEAPVLWFSPNPRGVLDFDAFRISRSFQKFLRQTDFKITFNKNFPEVINACCHQRRPGQSGSWITSHLLKHYLEFHKAGYAHSVECWSSEGELVGGLYGVYVAGVFSGESMFFKRSNASKLCLYRLIEFLKEQGLSWMDIQMVTDNLEQLGGKYVSRKEFLKRLEAAKERAKPLQFPR